MADDDKKVSNVKRLDDYAESPLIPFECRRVRRTIDVVEELEGVAQFKRQFSVKLRGWILYLGLAGATWTALLVLKTAGKDILAFFH